MNHRSFATAFVAPLVGILPFFAPLSAQKTAQSPAEFFPGHTYGYFECNPFSAVSGSKGLKFAKLLKDPMLAELIQGAMQQIPQSQDPRAMLRRYPFDKAMGDAVAAGIVGFVARKGDFGDAIQKNYRFPRDGAVPRDLFRGQVNFQPEMLAAIKLEDEQLFLKTLSQLLSDTMLDGEPPKIAIVSGEEGSYQSWELPNLGQLYCATMDGYFLVAQHADTLGAAMARRKVRGASLASRTDFTAFAKRRGDRATAGIVHVGLDSAIELFSPMIPARDRKEMEMWGGFDYAGLQAGIGFHEGGVCEWLQVAFAEDPKGIFMNLARLWPAAGWAETETRRGTVYSASVTFDWAAFYKSTKFLMELCDVDMGAFERDAKRELGMNLEKDLLAAVGNTVGAVGVMPKLGFIPEISLVFKVRNRAKMERILAQVTAECRRAGLPTKRFTVPGGGPKATYINLGKDMPIKPAFVLTGDKLVVSPMPLMLKYAVRKSRHTGVAFVDMIPDPTKIDARPMFSYSYDPGPVTENLYADLLKLLDSGGPPLPIDPTDLPSPEFVGSCVSKLGIGFSIDPYFMALELHSPVGIALPSMIGAAAASAMQQQGRIN